LRKDAGHRRLSFLGWGYRQRVVFEKEGMLMNGRPTVTVPPEIEEAQLQFENWRCERKRGQRIPENLWGTAVELAKQHGVWPTARALNLDHNRLNRRVGNGDDEVNT